MALVVKDRVKQTTTTTGTGSIVLNGNVDGFQTFAAALANGDTTYYGIFVPSTNAYEVGLGTWTESTATLARTTILESSNSGSAVNLTAQAEVFITQPAEKAVYLDSSNNVTLSNDLTVTGDFTVSGTTTTIDTTNSVITDSLIELANGTSGSPSNDAGIVIERGSSDNAFIGYDESVDKFTVGTGSFTGASTGNLTISTGTLVANVEGNVTGNVTGNVSGSSGSTTGNAATATALETARNIAVTGAVTGNANFDGSGNISISTTATSDPTLTLSGDASGSATFTNLGNATLTVTVIDDSHNHVISNVDGLQTALDGKLSTTGTAANSQLLDSLDSTQFLRSDADDTTSGVITFTNTGTSPKLSLSGNGGSSSYNYIIQGSNDSGVGATHFINGSTRTTDGGASTYTIRNDIGPIRLGRTSQSTLIEGSGDLTYNSNEVWHAGNDGSGSGLDADLLDGVQGSSYLRSDQADTISGNLTIGGTAHIAMQENHFINRRFEMDGADNASTAYILLCVNATGNDVNGTITMDRTSGLRHACSWNVIVTAGTSLYPIGSLIGHGVAGNGQPSARLVTLTYSSVSYVALEVTNPDVYHETTGAYFNGRIVNSGSNTFTVLKSSSVSSISDLTQSNSKAIIGHDLDINGDINAVDNIYLASSLIHEGDTDTKLEFGTNYINLITGNSTSATLNSSGIFVNDGSVAEDYDALSGTTPTCNVDNGGMFSLTMTGNTTFTFSGASSGYIQGFVLQLTGNGSTVTWPSSVKWAGGTAPDAPANGETDILVFVTRDGGTNWYGALSSDAAA